MWLLTYIDLLQLCSNHSLINSLTDCNNNMCNVNLLRIVVFIRFTLCGEIWSNDKFWMEITSGNSTLKMSGHFYFLLLHNKSFLLRLFSQIQFHFHGFTFSPRLIRVRKVLRNLCSFELQSSSRVNKNS